MNIINITSDIDRYKYSNNEMGDKIMFYRSIFEPYNYFKTLIKKKKLPLDGAEDILESIDKNFGKDYYDTEYLIYNGKRYLYDYCNSYDLKGETISNLNLYRTIFYNMVKDDISSVYNIDLDCINKMLHNPKFRATAVSRNRSILIKLLDCFKVRPYDSMIRYKKIYETALKIKNEWSIDVNNLKVGDKFVGYDIKYDEDTEDIILDNRDYYGYHNWLVKKITKCYIVFENNKKKNKDKLQEELSRGEYIGIWYKIQNYI